MNFFKSCCSTKDAGEPAKKSDMEKKPADDAAAAEAKPAEDGAAVEAAPAEAAPAEEAAAEEAPAGEAAAEEAWEKVDSKWVKMINFMKIWNW